MAATKLSGLMQFLYTCPIGLLDFDASGVIGLMNSKAMLLMQPLATTTYVSNFFTAFQSCGPELRNLAQGFEGRRGTVCENRRIFVRGDTAEDAGDALVLDCTMVKLSDERFSATLADVSRQVAQERRLRQAEVWFSSLLDSADAFDVLSLDPEGRIDGVRDDLIEATGLTREAVMGHTLAVFDWPDPDRTITDVANKVSLARRDGWHLDEGWHRTKGGGRRWCQRLTVVRSDHAMEREGDPDRAVSGFVTVLRSTTRQGFDTTKLRRMLQTDHLTGACNRAHFFEVAERELRRCVQIGNRLSVVALDVDHFKRINDTYGHAVGDEVLKSITVACQGALDSDCTFARLGGEEFVALLATDAAGALAKAEALRMTLADLEIPLKAGMLRVTASFGCSSLSPSARSVATLLAEADKALYTAKHAGRNRVHVFEGTI